VSDDGLPVEPGPVPPPGQPPPAEPMPPATPAREELPWPIAAVPGPTGPAVFEPEPEPEAPGSPAPSAFGPGAPQPEPEPLPPSGDPDHAGLAESFLTVWLRPRETVRRIVARDPRYMVLAIAALGGIPQLLATLPRGDRALPLDTTLLAGLLAGPLFGMAGLYFGGWLTRLAGRWFLRGPAGGVELRAALGWAALPHVVALPLWLLATAAFGAELYTAGSELIFRSPIYALFALTNLALQVWSLVIACHGVAEVQAFGSAWKGLWNLVLGFLLALALVLVLGLLLMVLALLLGPGLG